MVAYILLLAVLVFVLISSFILRSPEIGDYHDLGELKAFMLLMLLFVFYSSITSGLSSGSSFFGLHDVNLLFSAPISPKKILIYGLVRQMSTSLIASVFILFQAHILKERYDITLDKLLLLLLAYALALVVSEIIAMVIYTFTNGHDHKKKAVRVLMYASFLPLAVAFVTFALNGASPIDAAVKSLNASWVDWYPFIGWITGAVFALLSEEIMRFYLFAGLTFLGTFSLIIIIIRTNIDYYEDVLQATEKMYFVMEAAKEGRISDSKSADKIHLKDRKGIGRGKGASVLFFKHMLENKRGGYLLFDNTSFIQVVAMIVFALVIGMDSGIGTVFIFSVFFQLFTQSVSRWIKELILPYIFLIPVSPFKKLIFACLESVIKTITDGLLIFIPVGLIMNATALDIVACIIARTGFGILFIAGNVLSEKVLGAMSSKGLLVFLYLAMMALLGMPGILLAFTVPLMTASSHTLAIGLVIMFIWNTAIAGLVIGLCKNILHYTDISSGIQ